MSFARASIIVGYLLILLLDQSASAQSYVSDFWFPVVVDGKAGYIDRTGKVVIEPKFDGASYFSEGLARVSSGRDTIITAGFRQGFIDETGTLVIKPQWDVVSHFSEGLAAVGFDQTKIAFKVKGRTFYTSASHTRYRWGFVDKTGKLVVETKFVDVSEFRKGLAMAAVNVMSDRKYGFIDKQGNWVIQPRFEHANQFSEGLALVFVNGKYGFVDRSGKVVIKPVFASARDFSEGLACVKLGGDVISPRGVSATRNNADWAFIEPTGKIRFKVGRGGCHSFSDGLARFEVSGSYGFVDKAGRIVIDPKVNALSDFSHGLAEVILPGGGLGFIDKTGKVVVRPGLGKLEDFYRGLSEVCESYEFDAKCGYIDRSGNVIWPPTK